MTDNPNNLDEQTKDDNLNFNVSDEIVVKDKDGSYKVLIGGKLKKFTGTEISEVKKSDQKDIKPSILGEELFDEEGLVSKEPVEERLAPPVPAPWHKNNGAAFYFNTEDEEEVQKIAMEKKITPAIDLGVYAEDVISTSDLQLTNEAIKNKLKNIILARLKHVREQSDTRNVLIRSVAEGGMGFSTIDADKLILLIEEKLKVIESGEKMTQPDTELDKIIKQSENIYDFSEKIGKDLNNLEKNIDYHEELADQVADQNPEYTQAPEVSELIKKSKVESNVKKEINTSSSVVRKTISDSPRPKMEDVKQVSNLRSPIDELRYLGIAELRRAGTNSLDNIKMIKEKVEALGEESFIKKVEGIKAWRESPLYKLYVDIGRESMETGKSISKVIDAKISAGIETLSLAEFEKITDLNKEMKY